MIGRIEATLKARGLADNTYIVFSSDNGYHLGEHRLLQGKMTAFDTDIRVPLIVAGPGVPAGKTTTAIAENVDLRPTFSQLGGARVPGERRRAQPRAAPARQRRRRLAPAALVEHHGPDSAPATQTSRAPAAATRPPTRRCAPQTPSTSSTRDGEREYYNLARDPNELHNTYGRLRAKSRARLHNALRGVHNCHSGKSCWAAQRRAP